MRVKSWGILERGALLGVLALVFLPPTLVARERDSASEQEIRVRVPKSHANVHMGPTTARPVLVLASKDTVLRVVGRKGEWFEVELSPELRKTGMVMRWYKNEERGWMHQSTVEVVEGKE